MSSAQSGPQGPSHESLKSFLRTIGSFVYLCKGYGKADSSRCKSWCCRHRVQCVIDDGGKPVFKCVWTVSGVTHDSCSSNANTCVRQVFEKPIRETK